jgi:hypothetical protein
MVEHVQLLVDAKLITADVNSFVSMAIMATPTVDVNPATHYSQMARLA